MGRQQRPCRPENHWPPTLAALGAVFVGIGLARFAYTPLIPAVIEAGWFPAAEAAYLGAANLAGYLAGALAGAPLAARWGTRNAARTLMLVTVASFLACAWPAPFVWFFLWRFAAGVGGGALMVVAAPAALRLVPPAERGRAGGIIFTGVGLGIAASGTLTPALVAHGLGTAWTVFAAVAGVVTAATWRAWPSEPTAPASIDSALPPRWPRAAVLLVIAYGLIAAGLVPHMVFLVDYVARGLDAGLATGAGYWVLFGLGASAGPAAAGLAADRIGFAWTLTVTLAVEAAAVAILLASAHTAALAFSSIAVGAFVPGCVPLVIGRLQPHFADPHAQRRAWSRATATFALGQAGAAYLMSLVYARGGDGHRAVFALGTVAFVAALLLNLVADMPPRKAIATPAMADRRGRESA